MWQELEKRFEESKQLFIETGDEYDRGQMIAYHESIVLFEEVFRRLKKVFFGKKKIENQD